VSRGRCPECPHCRDRAVQAPGGKTDTSVRAAERLRATLNRTEDQIIAHLAHARGPMTANRLAELSGIPLHTVRPRCTYLQQIGRIRDSGQRFHISERSTAIAWELA